MNDLEELFFNFTTEHRKILNDIIRQSPKLMQGSGSFSLLVKNPKVLDFDNKRAYFTKQIHSRLHQQRHLQPPLQLNVRRDQIFLDSYKALYYKSADEMKYGKLNIRFNGEEGVDAGGVSREWFQVLARGMFNPDWALWQPVAADRTTFHPNPLSWINGEHLHYFKFIGRIIGKALHEGRVLDAHFSRAVYKRLLGKEPNLKDLESMDLDYYKSLLWILENDITDVISEDFSVIEEQFGEEKVVDLIPNGRNIPVTDENKREYVNAQVRYRLTTSVKDQLESFMKGFHDIIPAELVAIFDEQELELLISGLPDIDVDDWKANTEYHNYTANSPQVSWFWRIVRGMSNEERAKLLQFVTGTSKVPLNGFKDLEGMQGNTLFSIHKDPSQSRLPTSHTCFNQLDLPAYDDYDTLKNNLMTAINLGADYFGFA
jgi:E3 ubiquitin-protein ligase HUWE1